MRVKIDADECTGCGLCEDTCPEVFELDGDVAVVKTNPVPEGEEDIVTECAEDCPVDAIIIQ